MLAKKGQIEMECNSENISDANDVYLEGNFLFLLSFFITRKRNFFNKRLKAALRSSHPEVFLRKGVPKTCSKFTEKHPCQSAISIKLPSNFIEIALRHGRYPLNLLHIFWTPFLKNTFERLLLCVVILFYMISQLFS